jgi:hypothetical protein
MRLSKALFGLTIVALLLAISPLISTLLAAIISSSAGCVMNEGSASSCVILGMEMKDTLYAMAMSFWLIMFTWLYLPVALGIATASVIYWKREKQYPKQAKRAGWAFWFGAIGLLLLPLATDFALVLVAIGVAVWYFGRKSGLSGAAG